MPALATSLHIEERLGRALSPSEGVTANAYLEQASALLRLRVPSVDSRITAATLDPELVAGVVADAVIRVLRNPDGKVQESIDDYTYRRADAVADGSLYLTASEIASLSPVRSRIGSIALKQWWDV